MEEINFERIYVMEFDKLVNIGRINYGLGLQDARDAAQQALCVLLSNKENIEQETYQNWLNIVHRNYIFDSFRKRKNILNNNYDGIDHLYHQDYTKDLDGLTEEIRFYSQFDTKNKEIARNMRRLLVAFKENVGVFLLLVKQYIESISQEMESMFSRVFWLYLQEGDIPNISMSLGIPDPTVRSRIAKAWRHVWRRLWQVLYQEKVFQPQIKEALEELKDQKSTKEEEYNLFVDFLSGTKESSLKSSYNLNVHQIRSVITDYIDKLLSILNNGK